jgi:YgiT-type zinc finger domain-containing protein
MRLLLEDDISSPAAAGPVACVRCGGLLDRLRQVERLVRYETDVALVTVRGDVCPLCGEVLLTPGMAGLLLDARDVLSRGSAGWAVGCVYDLRRAE